MNWIRNFVVIAAVSMGTLVAQTPAKPSQPVAQQKQEIITRTGNSYRISVNSPRPLEQATDALRAKFGWLLSYEDPQYLSTKDTTTSDKGVLPAGGAFTTEIAAPTAAAEAPPEEQALKQLVEAYNHSGNPGQFELRKTGDDAFSIVGVGARDDKGNIASQKALLDTNLTIPVEERPIIETVNLVCQKASEELHMPVAIGVTPRALVDHVNVKVGGTKTTARTLLRQALAAASHPLYWRLLFDPATKSYLLNIHAMRAKPEIPSKPPVNDQHQSVPNQ